MTAIQGRQYTLKEIADFCETEMEKHKTLEPTVINECLPNGNLKVKDREYLKPEYHAYSNIKDKCNELLNQIKV